MKRDMDVIRSVLAEIEALPEQNFQGSTYTVRQADPIEAQDRVRHMLLLLDAGYLKGNRYNIDGSDALACPELTWAGHELIELIRDRPVWERIKAEVSKRGIPLTIDAVIAAGKALITGALG
jgi:hypothetical protein